MNRLNSRRRRAIAALGASNLIVIGALVLLLLRSTPKPSNGSPLPLTHPEYTEACRKATSRALLKAGNSGLVHTGQDGTILIQLQRSAVTESLRLDADDAIWAALEAVADSSDCRDLITARITVDFPSPAQESISFEGQCSNNVEDASQGAQVCKKTQAVAYIAVADIMQWSMGEIDDAELALRIDYRPP